MDTQRLREAIGPRADYFLKRFEKIERAGGGWVPGWNWPAFACSTAWFTYRRLDGWASGNFFFLFFGALATALTQSQVVFWAYLVVAFGLIPMYADAIYCRSLKSRLAQEAAAAAELPEKKRLRPPSVWSFVAAMASSAFALVLPLFLVIGPGAYSDYTPRVKVSEGVSLAGALRNEIGEFYAQNRRLPGPQEATQYRVEKSMMKYTDSVVYEAERKMIIVTMRDSYLAGKRFAMYATEKDGALTWDCRSIDLEKKYLPGACRD